MNMELLYRLLKGEGQASPGTCERERRRVLHVMSLHLDASEWPDGQILLLQIVLYTGLLGRKASDWMAIVLCLFLAIASVCASL